MNELYESVHYNNLKFEYVGPTKDVSICEYMDSREPWWTLEIWWCTKKAKRVLQ